MGQQRQGDGGRNAAQQRPHTGDVRRRHRGAVHHGVDAARHGRTHQHAGRHHRGFYFLPGRRSPAGERCHRLVKIAGANSEGARQAGRRAQAAAPRPLVARRKNRQNAGGSQRRQVRGEVLIHGVGRTPRADDDIRRQLRIAAGRQEPLKAGVNPRILTVAAAAEHFHADPARSRRNADAPLPHSRADGMCAVSMIVVRVKSAADGIKPRAVMLKSAMAQGAPVIGDQRRVLIIYAGIHPGDHGARAGNAQLLPHFRRTDSRHAPLRCRRIEHRGAGFSLEFGGEISAAMIQA